jgi:predicted anti-sigma-YlaC factor YlaD
MLVRAAPPVPDLTRLILHRTPAPDAERWPARIALLLVAFAQLTLASAQLFGVASGMRELPAGASMLDHLTHEGTAWNLAVGVGLLWAALRPSSAAGQLPVLTGFVAVLTAFSAADLITGTVTVQRVLTHVFVVAGVVLLYVVRHQHRGTRGPRPLAEPEPGSAETEAESAFSRQPHPASGRPRFRRPAGRHDAA